MTNIGRVSGFALLTVFCIIGPRAIAANAGMSPQVGARAIEAHVEFLADDLLEGRNNGTFGYEVAARYVQSQFLGMGLRPGNAGRWTQDISLVVPGADDDLPATLSINGVALDPKDASIYFRSETPVSWTGGLIFAGRKSSDREKELERIASLDVRGKLVALFPEPVGSTDRLQRSKVYEFSQKRDAILFGNGAAGVIMLPALELPAGVVPARLPVEPVGLMTAAEAKADSRYPILGQFSPTAAAKLFAGESRQIDQISASAARGEADSILLNAHFAVSGSRTWQWSKSANILGLIPGSDAKLRDELVVVTAHLDHIGNEGEPDGADQINNGALDNAVGVALLIEIARAMKKGPPPKRSVLFAAVACEEDGLIGSRYLAEHMPAGVGRPVAVLNIDMPILTYSFSDLLVFGGKESSLGEVAAAVARRQGLPLAATPEDMVGFFNASDHYSFVEKGVPALFLQPGPGGEGKAKIAEYMSGSYHSPRDDTRHPINWRAGSRFGAVNLAIIKEIANAPRAPQWYSDSRYGAAYAPSAKKLPRPRNVPQQ